MRFTALVQLIARSACLVVLIAISAPAVRSDELRLTVAMQPSHLEPRVGQPLRVAVTLKNVSDDPMLVLVRDMNFVLDIVSPAGTETIGSPRYTRPVSRFKDDEIPLRPGDALTRELPIQLNDLGVPFGEGWIAAPGTYRLRVRYDSQRSAQEHSAFVWPGSATSEWTVVRVRAPHAKDVTRWLEEAERCGASDECDDVELANFFRVVRDKRSPDRLLRLLEKRPYDIWLVDAIAFQARASDGQRLRDLAAKVDDPSIRKYYIDAVKRVCSPERCPKN